MKIVVSKDRQVCFWRRVPFAVRAAIQRAARTGAREGVVAGCYRWWVVAA
jgi:hypothetical protein